MPGGDGTGPTGMGPMTGRGAGYCAGYETPGYANPVPGRYQAAAGFTSGVSPVGAPARYSYGLPRVGLGMGRGMGRGRGRMGGRRW